MTETMLFWKKIKNPKKEGFQIRDRSQIVGEFGLVQFYTGLCCFKQAIQNPEVGYNISKSECPRDN